MRWNDGTLCQRRLFPRMRRNGTSHAFKSDGHNYGDHRQLATVLQANAADESQDFDNIFLAPVVPEDSGVGSTLKPPLVEHVYSFETPQFGAVRGSRHSHPRNTSRRQVVGLMVAILPTAPLKGSEIRGFSPPFTPNAPQYQGISR